jgi:hypothetical protein
MTTIIKSVWEGGKEKYQIMRWREENKRDYQMIRCAEEEK